MSREGTPKSSICYRVTEQKGKNMYHVCFEEEPAKVHSCMVQFDDQSKISLSPEEWNRIVKAGLESCGYLHERNVELIEMRECNHTAEAAAI